MTSFLRDFRGPFVTGEIAGNTAATVLPTLVCRIVKFKAQYGNAGRVYIGSTSGVTKAAGTTDNTTGIELSAGDETDWLVTGGNLNLLYLISDNAGDDLCYIAYT